MNTAFIEIDTLLTVLKVKLEKVRSLSGSTKIPDEYYGFFEEIARQLKMMRTDFREIRNQIEKAGDSY